MLFNITQSTEIISNSWGLDVEVFVFTIDLIVCPELDTFPYLDKWEIVDLVTKYINMKLAKIYAKRSDIS